MPVHVTYEISLRPDDEHLSRTGSFWDMVRDMRDGGVRGADVSYDAMLFDPPMLTVAGSERAVTKACEWLAEAGHVTPDDAADALEAEGLSNAGVRRLRKAAEDIARDLAAERQAVLDAGGRFTDPLDERPAVGAVVQHANHPQTLYPGGLTHDYPGPATGAMLVVRAALPGDPADTVRVALDDGSNGDGYTIKPGRLTYVLDPRTGEPVNTGRR